MDSSCTMNRAGEMRSGQQLYTSATEGVRKRISPTDAGEILKKQNCYIEVPLRLMSRKNWIGVPAVVSILLVGESRGANLVEVNQASHGCVGSTLALLHPGAWRRAALASTRTGL